MGEKVRIDEALESAYDRIRKNGTTMETKELTALLKEVAALEKAKIDKFSAEAEVVESEKKLENEKAAKDEEFRLREKELDIRSAKDKADEDLKASENRLKEKELDIHLAKDTTDEELRKNELTLRDKELDIRSKELEIRVKELNARKRKDIADVGVKIFECMGTVAASAVGVCGTLIGIKAIMAYENEGELFASAAKMLLPKIKV